MFLIFSIVIMLRDLHYLIKSYEGDFINFSDFVKNSKLLLVGEGNFSFALNLAKKDDINPVNIRATTNKSENYLSDFTKNNIIELSRSGSLIEFNIDATNLKKHYPYEKFDYVIFQFPHTGSRPSRGSNPNSTLIHDFIAEARNLLKAYGSIIITIVDVPFYEGTFRIVDALYKLKIKNFEVYKFDIGEFPDYVHSMTNEAGDALNRYTDFVTYVITP